MVQRIVGLSSGMDIDSMVKQLMNAEKVPLDKLKQKKQVLEWQRDDYRTLNAAFFDFRTILTNMKLTSQYRVRSTVSSNDSIVTATASSAAGLSSYTISNIKQLATAANKINTAGISKDPNAKVDVNKSLISQKDAFNSGSTIWDSTWKTDGVVESTSVTTNSDSATISFDLKGASVIAGSPMNITVNGKSYVVSKETDASKLGDNEVIFSQDSKTGKGTLTFKSNVSNGSSVKIDYIASSKNETQTINADSTGLQLSKGAIFQDKFTLNVNNKDYVLMTDSNNVTQIVEKGTADTSTSIGTIDTTTGKITFNQTFNDQLKQDAEAAGDSDKKFEVKVGYTQYYSTFNIQTSTSKGDMNQNFFIQGSDSLQSVFNQVNNSNVGVSMLYDSFSDRLTMTRTETGNFNSSGDEIITSGDFINNLLNFGSSQEKGGENAIFEINGLQTERNSNTFDMNGVTFTLKQTTKTTDAPVTLTVKNDSDKVFDNIKAFIDQYNKLIDQVQGKLNEERDRDYTPLTDDQREQLSDKQQEQWEAKAKSGLLRGDTTLSSALTQMRSSFYQSVQSPDVAAAFNQLASIGITTSADYTQGGKLQIDEAKLKKAIETDPSSVENLFRASGNTTASKGIAQRLYDNVNNTINALNDKAGKAYSTNNQFAIGKSLNDVNDQIKAFTDKLSKIEDRYYAQFTAMEQAIQKNNQQASYLQQYFGGGQ